MSPKTLLENRNYHQPHYRFLAKQFWFDDYVVLKRAHHYALSFNNHFCIPSEWLFPFKASIKFQVGARRSSVWCMTRWFEGVGTGPPQQPRHHDRRLFTAGSSACSKRKHPLQRPLFHFWLIWSDACQTETKQMARISGTKLATCRQKQQYNPSTFPWFAVTQKLALCSKIWKRIANKRVGETILLLCEETKLSRQSIDQSGGRHLWDFASTSQSKSRRKQGNPE